MCPVDNVKETAYNATMKRENLVKDNQNLNSVFEKYDTNKNGELDSDEINRALDDFAKIQMKSKKELRKEGYSKNEIKNLKSFMSNFFKEFKKDVFLDGKINFSSQGLCNDCWLLSGINALSYTDEGQKLLKDCISQDKNGNITVELKGVGKKYTFSKEELLSSNSSVNRAGGDYDMRALELAFKKYRIELKEETKDNPNRNGSIYTDVGAANILDPLSGGDLGTAIFILTGKKNESYYKNGTMEEYKQAIASGKIKPFFPIDMKETDLSAEDVAKYLDKIAKEPSRYAIQCTFDKGYTKNHAFSVKEVTDDYVIVVNPWNSAEEIKIPKEKFLKDIGSFCVVDMNKKPQN